MSIGVSHRNLLKLIRGSKQLTIKTLLKLIFTELKSQSEYTLVEMSKMLSVNKFCYMNLDFHIKCLNNFTDNYFLTKEKVVKWWVSSTYRNWLKNLLTTLTGTIPNS